MQEVSAQQDESSVGLFRGAGCVSSPSPLLLSLSAPFLPPSFLPSPSFFLRPPSILATPSYIIYPRAFIIQQRPQQTNIFVRMIRDTMSDDGISTIKGLQTVLILAMLVNKTVTSVLIQPKIIRRGFAIKIKPLLCDITNSSFLISQIHFVTSTNNL